MKSRIRIRRPTMGKEGNPGEEKDSRPQQRAGEHRKGRMEEWKD